MDELVAWLRGVLAEDERRAKADVDFFDRPGADPDDKSIANDARWLLADIAVKRAILDLHGSEHECPFNAPFERIESVWWGLPVGGGVKWCPTVRLLASAYAHRPGYRDEWRP